MDGWGAKDGTPPAALRQPKIPLSKSRTGRVCPFPVRPYRAEPTSDSYRILHAGGVLPSGDPPYLQASGRNKNLHQSVWFRSPFLISLGFLEDKSTNGAA